MIFKPCQNGRTRVSGTSRRSLLAAAAYLSIGLSSRDRADASTFEKEVLVVLKTELGVIEVAVDMLRAPVSAGDFLKYVDLGLFAGGNFFRTVRLDNDVNPVKINAVQGGAAGESLPPIIHEPTNQTGIRHDDGSISLGRTTPGSAVGGSFFICIGAQPALDFGGHRNPDGLGFAAFGRVKQGMSVVRAIWSSKTNGSDEQMGGQMLACPVLIAWAKRV